MSKPTVLIAGITGTLGTKIATAILHKGAMQVKGLVRPGTLSDDLKQQKLANLTELGVSFVEGSLSDLPSLEKACEGVDVVVSTVKGVRADDEPEVILFGQINLMEAAKRSGVKRFVPSDYSVDYFKLDWLDNYNLDCRKLLAEKLMGSGLGYTFILNGAFTEVQLSPWGRLFDFQAGTFTYWGDGEIPCDLTTMDDTAKYTAEAIADPMMENRALKVAGDVLTMKQILAAYEETTGKKLIEKQSGSVEQLKVSIEQSRNKAKTHFEYLAEQYHYTLVSGKGKFDQLDNDLYPHIQPTTVREFIAMMSS
jgi:nucleoside-diphosphate-sugar epimerase